MPVAQRKAGEFFPMEKWEKDVASMAGLLVDAYLVQYPRPAGKMTESRHVACRSMGLDKHNMRSRRTPQSALKYLLEAAQGFVPVPLARFHIDYLLPVLAQGNAAKREGCVGVWPPCVLAGRLRVLWPPHKVWTPVALRAAAGDRLASLCLLRLRSNVFVDAKDPMWSDACESTLQLMARTPSDMQVHAVFCVAQCMWRHRKTKPFHVDAWLHLFLGLPESVLLPVTLLMCKQVATLLEVGAAYSPNLLDLFLSRVLGVGASPHAGCLTVRRGSRPWRLGCESCEQRVGACVLRVATVLLPWASPAFAMPVRTFNLLLEDIHLRRWPTMVLATVPHDYDEVLCMLLAFIQADRLPYWCGQQLLPLLRVRTTFDTITRQLQLSACYFVAYLALVTRHLPLQPRAVPTVTDNLTWMCAAIRFVNSDVSTIFREPLCRGKHVLVTLKQQSKAWSTARQRWLCVAV